MQIDFIFNGFNNLIEIIKNSFSKLNIGCKYILQILTESEFKTQQQNKFFHSLLQAFYDSNYSSFISYDDARLYYKRLGGLVIIKHRFTLSNLTKKILWVFLQKAPIEEKDKKIIIQLLKGEIETELSWSYIKKKNATFVINQLIKDCENSGALADKKVRKIIETADKEGIINLIDNYK